MQLSEGGVMKESGPIPAIELHNSSIKSFKLQTLYTRVSSSYYQAMTIMTSLPLTAILCSAVIRLLHHGKSRKSGGKKI